MYTFMSKQDVTHSDLNSVVKIDFLVIVNCLCGNDSTAHFSVINNKYWVHLILSHRYRFEFKWNINSPGLNSIRILHMLESIDLTILCCILFVLKWFGRTNSVHHLFLGELSGLHNCHSCSFMLVHCIPPAMQTHRRHASNRQSIAANACYSCRREICFTINCKIIDIFQLAVHASCSTDNMRTI